ncbi:MAG: hypothetical protein IT378_25770 [Sandaracinaceae bacterium]|nr:hypothetical protein [Sandaracinaceae bacterium]
MRHLLLCLSLSIVGCDSGTTVDDGGSDAGTGADAGTGGDAGSREDAAAPSDAGTDGGNDTDGGPAQASVACSDLPEVIAGGTTDDPYYTAVLVCGSPAEAACTVREDTDEASCTATGARFLIGYDFTDAAQVRLRSAGWAIDSATAGTIQDVNVRTIPLDAEASVTLRSPAGMLYRATFTVTASGTDTTVSLASWAAVP